MPQVRTQSYAKQPVDLMRPFKKFLLSAFVVGTFGIYALHERMSNEAGNVTPPNNLGTDNSGTIAQNPTQNTGANTQAQQPIPTATTPGQGQYKDGTYTGNQANAFYGYVQVSATIQGGRITDVQFLDYPHDRRTSQEINSQATPWLHDEAIQAQSAQVDIISGATLTSEAFVQSLQSALNQAHS